MRYDKKIYFVKSGEAVYDKSTGDYIGSDPTETEIIASVSPTTINTMRLVYGEIRQGSVTVHLLNHYDAPFDYIRIGNKKYSVNYKRMLRTKEALVCTEVQNG